MGENPKFCRFYVSSASINLLSSWARTSKLIVISRFHAIRSPRSNGYTHIGPRLAQLGPTNTLKQMSETLQPSLLPEKVRKETFEDFFGNDLMYDIRT